MIGLFLKTLSILVDGSVVRVRKVDGTVVPLFFGGAVNCEKPFLEHHNIKKVKYLGKNLISHSID